MMARTAAEEIERLANRTAFAEGVRYFAVAFGRTLAALLVGVMFGLFAAWALWLFWFAAAASWTVLVSPAFIAGAELVAFLGVAAAWRLVGKGLK